MSRTERLLVAYSPVWIGVMAYVMFSGIFKQWGDATHLVFGLALALPVWLIAIGDAHAKRFVALITLYSFIQCYFGSKLFFESFGMQYHFHVTPKWTWNGTPAFLYFVTVAYFSTYYVALVLCWRFIEKRVPSVAGRLVFRALLSYAIAFAETATMTHKVLADYFTYRDNRWVMLYGSICYGTIFFITLPQFYKVKADDKWWPLVRDTLAYNLLILICYELYAFAISKLV
jgi:cycloeucalenol cycloisomerase